MRVLAYLFPKLLFPKEVATETSRKSCFRTPFGNQRVNGLILKAYSEFFIEILKYSWNLEHFEKKYDNPSLIISEIIFLERGWYWND